MKTLLMIIAVLAAVPALADTNSQCLSEVKTVITNSATTVVLTDGELTDLCSLMYQMGETRKGVVIDPVMLKSQMANTVNQILSRADSDIPVDKMTEVFVSQIIRGSK